MDSLAQAQPFGRGCARQEGSRREGMLALQGVEAGAQGAPVALRQGGTQDGHGGRVGAGAP